VSWPAVRAALDTRLTALPGIDPAKIAWPNRVYDPSKSTPPGAPYWKVDLLPAGVAPVFSGGDHEFGVFQVSRWVPAGAGIAQALLDAQAMVDHFKKQTLSGIACGVPTIAPPIQEADWMHIPVSIPFQVL
jgi:hypothetical protein